MFVLKFVGKMLLVPVWFVLLIVWGAVKLAVSVVSVAYSFVYGMLLCLLIGTLIWFRQDWMRYIIIGVAAGGALAVLFAGVFVETLISESRRYIGSLIIG